MSGSWSKHWSQIRTDIASIASTVSGGKLLCDTELDTANIGAATDTPYVGTEDNTARSLISLSKGLKNHIYTLLTSIGGTTDAVASVSADEDGTARSSISILKASKNLLIDLSGYLSTLAGGVNTNKYQISSIPEGTASIGSTKDNGPAWTPVQGVYPFTNVTTAASFTAAPTSGQKIVAPDVIISVLTACRVSILEKDSATEIAAVNLAANSPYAFTLRDCIRARTANKELQVKTSAVAVGDVSFSYHSEA